MDKKLESDILEIHQLIQKEKITPKNFAEAFIVIFGIMCDKTMKTEDSRQLKYPMSQLKQMQGRICNLLKNKGWK